MINLLRAEWLKMTTIRLWWGMLLGAMALSAVGVVAQIAGNGARGGAALPLTEAATQRSIAASASTAYLFSVVVGIILITSEFRHFTSRPTFLIEPRRGRVIVAKMMVAAVVGIGYGVACAAITALLMVSWLGIDGVGIGWIDNGVLVSLLSAVVVIAAFAVVGVGVGVLLRSQIAAVMGALGYLFAVEPLVQIIPGIKHVYRFLPGAAANAITGGVRPGASALVPWQGALVLLGWGLLFAACGWVVTIRRDIA